jgi:hypothetical protein
MGIVGWPPTPVVMKRVRKLLEGKGLPIFVKEKSAQELERKGDRSKSIGISGGEERVERSKGGKVKEAKSRGPPMFFVSVASKGVRFGVSRLFATLVGKSICVACKGLTWEDCWRESNVMRWRHRGGVRSTTWRARPAEASWMQKAHIVGGHPSGPAAGKGLRRAGVGAVPSTATIIAYRYSS